MNKSVWNAISKHTLLSAAIISISACMPETSVTDNSSDNGGTTPTPPPIESTATVIPYYDYSAVLKAEVYVDNNDDNIIESGEYLGTTDNKGEYSSTSLAEMINDNSDVSVMVKLVKDVTIIKNTKGDYTIPETVWMAYDLETLSNSALASIQSSTTETQIHVNSISTWVQGLMNNENLSFKDASNLVNDTLAHSSDIDIQNPNYDNYNFATYTRGLEVKALARGEYCCVSVVVPEFEIVGTKITWSFDEIYARGDEPDVYEPPTFKYDQDGELIIVIPSEGDDSTAPDTGDYDGSYDGDGEFIDGSGNRPISTNKDSSSGTGSTIPNRNSAFGYTVINDKLSMAFTRKEDGIPSIATLNVDFDNQSVLNESTFDFEYAGSIYNCDPDDSWCHPTVKWPNATRDIKAFSGWGGEALLSVEGPTKGTYNLLNSSWSKFIDIDAITVWKKCSYGGNDDGEYCTSYMSYMNFLDTIFKGVMYGPSGFYNYLSYGGSSESKLTYRNALRVHRDNKVEVGKEGDFELLGSLPVNVMNTFRMRGGYSTPLLGWFNERDDSVRGIAINKNAGWAALGDTDYDKMNALYSTSVLLPKASATSIKGSSEYIVGSIEFESEYDISMAITGYRLNIRKYDSEDALWSTSWIKFDTENPIKSMDVTTFNDGSLMAAICLNSNKMSLLRWSTALSLPGLGVLERHDTEETCGDIQIIESTPFNGGEESIVMKNDNILYGLSSDGGYIKISENVTPTSDLKWFSSPDGWVLTGSDNNVMIFSKDATL